MPTCDAFARLPHPQAASRQPAYPQVATPRRPRRCPLCQSLLLAPAATVVGDGGEVRHLWSCDDCGYAFCTSIRVAAGEIRARQI